jgi:hypothetical protein
VGALSAYVLISPGPLARSFNPGRFAPNPRAGVIEQAIRSIPAEARLLAQTDLLPHVAHRPAVYMFPDSPAFADADYVLLDLEGNKYPLSNPEDDYDRELQQFLLNPDFETIFDRDNMLVLRRRATPLAPTTTLTADFGRRIALDGYQLQPETVSAGAPTTVTLWLRAQTDIAEDYILFVHVLAPDDERVAQLDVTPTEEWFGTSYWKAGRRFRVPYQLAIPAGLAPGDYRIVVGFYEVNGQRRLGVVGGGSSVELPDRLSVR